MKKKLLLALTFACSISVAFAKDSTVRAGRYIGYILMGLLVVFLISKFLDKSKK